jgi:hypothetical protein
MRQISGQGLQPNRVRAVFDDDVVFFTLPQGATLAQLADRLGELGRRHIGSPVSIQVEFGSLQAPDRHKSPSRIGFGRLDGSPSATH